MAENHPDYYLEIWWYGFPLWYPNSYWPHAGTFWYW